MFLYARKMFRLVDAANVHMMYATTERKLNRHYEKSSKTKKIKNQPRVVDHSARGSMKNAANCVQTCELQDT